MKISFIGDISLNDNYIELYKKGINPFKVIEPVLASNDFIVGNLECLANGNKGENELKKPRLRTTVETLNYLKNINLNVACLAQNHVYDHLGDGFQKTIDFLDQNEILHLGAGLSIAEAEKHQIIQKDGVSIALINYVTYDTNPNLPADAAVYLNMFDKVQCKKDIQCHRTKVNYIVLSLHWGGRVEGGLFPDWDQPKIAHELIDAGADLIIGHHSHTIQPYEVYKGRYIFYSLGNFAFSDIYVDGNIYSKLSNRQKKSIIVNVDFKKHCDYSVSIIPIQNNRGYIKLRNKVLFTARYAIINFLFYFIKRNKYLWRFYYIKFKVLNPILNYFFVQKRSILGALKLNKILRLIKQANLKLK